MSTWSHRLRGGDLTLVMIRSSGRWLFGSLIHSVSRNPSLSKQLFGYAILGFALSEAMALFALLVAFLILFVLLNGRAPDGCRVAQRCFHHLPVPTYAYPWCRQLVTHPLLGLDGTPPALRCSLFLPWPVHSWRISFGLEWMRLSRMDSRCAWVLGYAISAYVSSDVARGWSRSGVGSTRHTAAGPS
jgi:hypothetical protein